MSNGFAPDPMAPNPAALSDELQQLRDLLQRCMGIMAQSTDSKVREAAVLAGRTLHNQNLKRRLQREPR